MSTERRIYRNGKLSGVEYTTRHSDGSKCVDRYRASPGLFGGVATHGKPSRTTYGPRRKS